MASDTIIDTRMDDLVAEAAKWDMLKKDCTIGYVMWSIWPGRNSLWGKPNGRKMTQERRARMYKSFLGEGIQNVKNDTVIVVAVKKSWIQTALQVASLEGLKAPDLPTLQWTEEGEEAFDQGEFCPVEGMGRRAGVGKLYESRTAQLEMMEKELEKMTQKKDESEDDFAKRKQTKQESIAFLTASRQ